MPKDAFLSLSIDFKSFLQLISDFPNLDHTIKVTVFLHNTLTTHCNCKRKHNEVGDTLEIKLTNYIVIL